MAQNDIIDLDPLLPEEQLLSQAIPVREENQEAVIDKVYKPRKGDFIPADFKNFLVDKLNVAPSIIDTVLGRPYEFRDRFINLNPLDAIRDIARFSIMGDQPLREGQQPFGFNLKELVSPTSPEVRRAEAAGIDTEKGAPFFVAKDAEYLPADQRDRGIKLLLSEAYPNTPISEFDLKLEPRTNRVTFIDPDSGNRQFINPPGIDFAEVTAIMEPVALELAAGALGLGYGLTAGKVQGATAGGTAGVILSAQATDNPLFQAASGAAGATVGAISSPIVFTALGEGLAHYMWRISNLRGLKQRGILDETYTSQKINETAMKDAGLVTLFSGAGATLFSLLGKLATVNPLKLGIKEDEFIEAYDKIKKMQTEGTPAEKKALEDITTPEVLSATDTGLPGVRKVLQKEVEETARRRPEAGARLESQAKAREEGFDEVFKQTNINPKIVELDDLATTNQTLGERILRGIDLEEEVEDVAYRALLKKLKALQDDNTPENLFKTFWKKGEISNSQVLRDNIPEELVPDFQTLIYRDFIDKTGRNPKNIKQYLNDHGDNLRLWYGDDFVDGLKGYNKLLDNIKIVAEKEGIPEDELAKTMVTLARAYVGIFTRPGRFITAGTRLREGYRRNSFEDMIMNPDRLYKRIQRRKFFSNPEVQGFIRALSRGYGQAEVLDRAEADQPTGAFKVDVPTVELEGTELAPLEEEKLSRGGEPLMRLKYNL